MHKSGHTLCLTYAENQVSWGRFVVGPLCRQPLTALRLEMWLRPLLGDAAGPSFDTGEDIEKSFPDVFRTAQTLARAIAIHASYLIHRGSPGVRSPLTQGYAGGFGGIEFSRPSSYVACDDGSSCGTSKQGFQADGRLEAPRRALAGRLQKSPAAPVLISWVSSIVKTVKEFRRWLPWQPFADELRELLSARQHPAPDQTGGGGGGAAAEGKTFAADAAVFAVCELLLAWEEAGQVRTNHFQFVLGGIGRSLFCQDSWFQGLRGNDVISHHEFVLPFFSVNRHRGNSLHENESDITPSAHFPTLVLNHTSRR